MIDGLPREGGVEGRVLLVDDDAVIRKVYSRILQKVGCVVKTAASGASALELLHGGRFDLIVIDINMAGMSGTQLLRAVREHNLDVPVILMTGDPGVTATREAVDYRAFQHLAKPIGLDTFAQAVRSAIHTHVVTAILAERAPLLDACRRIVRATCQGGEWDFAATWVPSDGEHMHCAETWARPGHDVVALENATMTLEVVVESGFPKKGWTCASPDWMPDLSMETSVPRLPFAIAAGFKSSFVVPIGTEGEVFAVLEFFSRKNLGPDLALLALFARTSAQLSTQVLRERAEQRATRAETAHNDALTIRANKMVFLSQSEIVVPSEQGASLERAFAARSKLVDGHAGFLGLELLKDLRAEGGRYVLLTRWRSRQDFVAYMRSGDHGRAHERPHDGLDMGTLHGGKLQQYQVVLSEQVDEPSQP